MKFSRFMWLLQNKQLWLSRADLLGDPWEIALAGDQLAHVVSRHPISPLPLTRELRESALDRSKRIITAWRQKTYINCWCLSEHESHALWRIYCGANEGVAVQTSLGNLRKSVGHLRVYRVKYETPGRKKQTPTLVDLVTIKRPVFAYESEIRIVATIDNDGVATSTLGAPGYRVDWELERCVEFVRVHPDADCSFIEVVAAALEVYAPSLKDRIAWSAMKEAPPL